ncbi:hypothetical protein BCR43DRAFT_499417 [Syncephalastrum racemosum]|uniref:NADH:flavin oxidoreductase/NADH oxidase N-terminal domain-containing protein n=1 Tax=Syncephalastrum racemosum TaxID=13706 RepID=A0A1X2H0B2_SYNRA|nr:hypothetical protein BCR43DRAFT_499417 [Syncephalastrum racemosum]
MVTTLSSSSALFQPIKVGKYDLQHRVVLPAMTRLRNNRGTSAPSDLMVEYYQQRATQGGLLIAEATGISESAGSFPGVSGIYTDDQVAAWKKVTDAVHTKGGIIFLQLWHAGRSTDSSLLPGNKLPVAPSAVAIPGPNIFSGKDHEVPRALEVHEIQEIVQEFVKAAERAIEAGFDGVEIHGANGFLIDQFLNTSSNKRTDAYGGSIENRTRFAREVVDAVSAAIGEEITALRLSPWSEANGVEDETPYATWAYLTEQLQMKHPKLAYLHFIEPRDDMMPKTDVEARLQLSLDPFRAIWKGPFISAGGYTTDPKLAKEVADQTGNLIAFGRTYVANPDLVQRLKNEWPLNKYNRDLFYTDGPEGYIDYKTYSRDPESVQL